MIYPSGVHNMIKVQVCAFYLDGILGPEFSKQVSLSHGWVRLKGGATGWTGVDMSTPLSSGQYSFLSKNDIKIVMYPRMYSLFVKS